MEFIRLPQYRQPKFQCQLGVPHLCLIHLEYDHLRLRDPMKKSEFILDISILIYIPLFKKILLYFFFTNFHFFVK